MDNTYYATILSQVAALMKIKGANRFKIRAFENAAHALKGLTGSIEDVMDAGQTTEIEGIGKSIAKDLQEIRDTGTCAVRTSLLEELDPGLLDLMNIQGLGPKRIKALYDELGVGNLPDLKRAAEDDLVQALDGFGQKTQDKILGEIERLLLSKGRTPLPAALGLAVSFRDALLQRADVERCEIAGSIRRQKDTTGDIDLLVATTSDPTPIMQAFIDTPGVTAVIAQGDKKTSVLTVQDIQIDLRVVSPDVFGSALHYFTGSKEHHVKLRTIAKRKGLKISEYGVFDTSQPEDAPPIASLTEHDLYRALELDYIPPELRQGLDEIELAIQHTLPDLIDLQDVRSDLHMHTTASDGEHTILEMALAAKGLGYTHIVITDHSGSLKVANGLDPARFAKHIEDIKHANTQIEGFEILSGLEVDILKDGSLDMDDDLLRACDWVVGSVHLFQNLDKEAMTTRLLNAIGSGLLDAIGHPTGRLLGGRKGYDYAMDDVLVACRDARVAVEINGSPGRLDFNAAHAKLAKSLGVRITLGSDAHSTRGLASMPFAVGQARRAGLTKDDVVNCLDVAAFKALRAN